MASQLTTEQLNTRLWNVVSTALIVTAMKNTINMSSVSFRYMAMERGHYSYTHLTASFPRQPGSAGTRKVKPIWI